MKNKSIKKGEGVMKNRAVKRRTRYKETLKITARQPKIPPGYNNNNKNNNSK